MSFKTGEGEGVKAGSVPGGPSREIGCRVIDLMRRATPKGAQKPWKTQHAISLIASIAADIDEISLMEHVEGCAQVVEAGLEEVLIVTGVEHMGDVVSLLGSGRNFGCRFTYKVQDEAGGIAQALA